MSERLSLEDTSGLPVSEDVPLAYLLPEEEGYRPDVYYFDRPDLEDRYVVRPLQMDDYSYDRPYTRAQQVELLHSELQRLNDAGVRVPHTVTGLPADWHEDSAQGHEQGRVLIATDRITPVDPRSVDPALLATQARRTVIGMATFLNDSWSDERRITGQPYLHDVLKAEQLVYGKAPGETSPDFYMVDTGLSTHYPDVDDPEIYIEGERENVLQTARQLAELTGDESLPEQAQATIKQF